MAVATTITMGMSKRLGDRLSIRKDVKKGYLTREAGDTIDVTAGLQASFLSAGIRDALESSGACSGRVLNWSL